MRKNQIKPGLRVYHALFGWCEILYPPTKEGKVIVNLEADEIEYFTNSKGLVVSNRDKSTGKHVLLTPIKELLKNDQNVPKELAAKKIALKAKFRVYEKKEK